MPTPSDLLEPVQLALFNARCLVNKAFILNDVFTTRKLDVLFIKETWLNANDLTPLGDLRWSGI